MALKKILLNVPLALLVWEKISSPTFHDVIYFRDSYKFVINILKYLNLNEFNIFLLMLILIPLLATISSIYLAFHEKKGWRLLYSCISIWTIFNLAECIFIFFLSVARA